MDLARSDERFAACDGRGAQLDFSQLGCLIRIARVDFGHVAQPHQTAGALTLAAQMNFGGVANHGAAKPDDQAVRRDEAARVFSNRNMANG
ncbi:MAG: hypothetical protein ACREJM_05240 [Candidatus Saccharimonadales bacterium]